MGLGNRVVLQRSVLASRAKLYLGHPGDELDRSQGAASGCGGWRCPVLHWRLGRYSRFPSGQVANLGPGVRIVSSFLGFFVIKAT